MLLVWGYALHVFTKQQKWRQLQPEELPAFLKAKNTKLLANDASMLERHVVIASELRTNAAKQYATALIKAQSVTLGQVTMEVLDGKTP